jgi:surfactin family lipopeptide synthetase A
MPSMPQSNATEPSTLFVRATEKDTMPTDADHLATLPPDQQRIWAKCYHPTGTFIPFPKEAVEQSIPDRFEQMVRSYPSRPAVQDRHETLTYAELNEQANRVAHAILAQRGSGAEPIALLFDKGTRHIAATLGVLKAGKFYLPLDPSYPPRRTLDILKNAEVGCVLTSTTQLSLLDILAPQRCDVLNVDGLDTILSSGYEKVRASIAPDTFADLIYTSGSTGQPKGVVRSHRFVLQKVMAYTNIGHLGAADRVSLLPACGSSAAVHITLSPLLNGATLCVFDVQQEGLEALARWLIPCGRLPRSICMACPHRESSPADAFRDIA